jgi:hypothetical protein
MRDRFQTDLLRISQPDKIIRIEKGKNTGQENQNTRQGYY